MGTPETDTLKEKIFQLESLNKRMVEAMESMVAISDFQRDIQAVDSIDQIYKIASQKFTKITPLRFAAFFSINKEMNFSLSYNEPEDIKEHIEEEFNKQLMNGVLAWALNSERAVAVKPETEYMKAGKIFPILFVKEPLWMIEKRQFVSPRTAHDDLSKAMLNA